MTVDFAGKRHRIIGHYNVIKDIHIFPNACGISEIKMYLNTLMKKKHFEFFFFEKIIVHCW